MKSGEVWLVNFSPSVGQEIAKPRPAVIVSNDRLGGLDLRIVVPITDAKKPARPWHVKVRATYMNNLKKDSLVDCCQLKSFSTERFYKRIGSFSSKDMDDVKTCISGVLELL